MSNPPNTCLHLFILTYTKKAQTVNARAMSFSPSSYESHLPPDTPNIYFDSRNAHGHALLVQPEVMQRQHDLDFRFFTLTAVSCNVNKSVI
jgi:hypothetical protein